MLRVIGAIVWAVVFLASACFAADEAVTVSEDGVAVVAEQEAAQAPMEGPVEVGNRICPVGGEEIPVGKEAKIEHNGKVYNLCCPMCAKDFKKDPEKYVKKVEESMKAAQEVGEAGK